MAATQAEKAQAFAQMHQRPEPFVIPNPWDAGTARILAGLGFAALATTSAGMAFALGRRDGAVAREAAMAHVRAIVEATPLPVSGDLENGYGHAPEYVAETIRLAAGAGLVGASIEDSTGDAERPIYDIAQAVERVAAAAAAARSLAFPFVLTARAENFLWGRADLDDTIERLRRFEAAGADVLYAPGLRTIDEVRRVCAAVTKPVNVLAGMGGTSFTVEALATAGARRISLGSALARASFGALLRAAREIKDAGTFTFLDAAAPTKELAAFFAGREEVSK